MGERSLCTAGLAVALAMLAGCGSAAASDPAETIRAACSRCHTLDRIKAKADEDRAFWGPTVERMRARGARIDDGQRDAVVEFLSSGGAANL